MADSTTNVDVLVQSQASKEITVNNFFDAASRAIDFARRGSSSSGLTWGHFGTPRLYVNATPTAKASDTVSLTASSTRYVCASRSFALSQVATAFDPDKIALYKVVTGTASVTSYEDHRDPHHLNRFLYGRVAIATADANVTLTYEQAMCESLELTGALTVLRDVIVPTVPRDYKIFANVTGGVGIRVKTTAGTGITISDGKRAIVECDGTNVVRVTADV